MNQNRYRVVRIITLLGLLAAPLTAAAYIGPGMGAGAIATVLGVIAAVLLAVFAVVYYPLKRLFKRLRAKPAPSAKTDSPDDGEAE